MIARVRAQQELAMVFRRLASFGDTFELLPWHNISATYLIVFGWWLPETTSVLGSTSPSALR